MTSAMAVCEMSMLPRTHCSAAISCGGVRSNSLSRDDNSDTLTSAPPVVSVAHTFHVYLTATTVWGLASRYAKPVVEAVVDCLCIHAEMSVHSACGQPVDYLTTSSYMCFELGAHRPPPVC